MGFGCGGGWFVEVVWVVVIVVEEFLDDGDIFMGNVGVVVQCK